MTRLRRAGSPWRLLVHEWAGRSPGRREGGYGVSHHVTNDASFGGLTEDGEWSRTHLLPASAEFDELVVGGPRHCWLHVEQMDVGTWHVDVAGVVLWVTVDRDGRARQVTTYGPGCYSERVPGCEYAVAWDPDVGGAS